MRYLPITFLRPSSLIDRSFGCVFHFRFFLRTFGNFFLFRKTRMQLVRRCLIVAWPMTLCCRHVDWCESICRSVWARVRNDHSRSHDTSTAGLSLPHTLFFTFALQRSFNIPCLCRGSVVRTSVFNWRTFWSMPDLWLTCDHFVGKVSAMGQPTTLTQPFIPSESINE